MEMTVVVMEMIVVRDVSVVLLVWTTWLVGLESKMSSFFPGSIKSM